MQNRPAFKPQYLSIYDNQGGGTFRCVDRQPRQTGKSWNAMMQNVKSGWTFMAKDIRIWSDGKIDWGWSVGGHFEEVKQ